MLWLPVYNSNALDYTHSSGWRVQTIYISLTHLN